jgi:hypothetical protein
LSLEEQPHDDSEEQPQDGSDEQPQVASAGAPQDGAAGAPQDGAAGAAHDGSAAAGAAQPHDGSEEQLLQLLPQLLLQLLSQQHLCRHRPKQALARLSSATETLTKTANVTAVRNMKFWFILILQVKKSS